MAKRFTPLMLLVALCWVVFVVNNLLWSGYFNQYGIIPRHFASLPGILWAPLLHGSFKHLVANTVPLLVLGGILCARGKSEFPFLAVVGTMLAGALTWIFARDGCHIGASGLIFCLFGYLASMAYFRRTFGTVALSAVCLLGYGGMLKGLLPTSPAISWEGHVAGLVAGIALAWSSSQGSRRR
ncbi:MAG TPA: rhomboid family intramembrane serine protease [Candidatus Sulfotelmatobacter sp.]|nr:rhomboid family intramembrane serine protease [Candidatus Sulfotelmatobacter sp.]HWI55709.1 rhomboid family intramembrane serine protease [Bacillota bacterium]